MDRGRIYGIVRTVTKYVGLGIGIAVVSYVSVALSVSTENEKRLMSENQALKEEYENLREKMELVGSVISDLEVRDRTIYRDVFNADLPAGTAEPDTSELQVGNLFDKSAEELVWETYVKGRKVDFTVSRVNGWLENINANLLKGEEGDGPALHTAHSGLRTYADRCLDGAEIQPFLQDVETARRNGHNGSDRYGRVMHGGRDGDRNIQVGQGAGQHRDRDPH